MPSILTDTATFSEVYALTLLAAMAYQRKKGKRQFLPPANHPKNQQPSHVCPSRIRRVG